MTKVEEKRTEKHSELETLRRIYSLIEQGATTDQLKRIISTRINTLVKDIAVLDDLNEDSAK